MLLLELIAIAFTHCHDRGQVDLVERRQHRRRLLCCDEPFGNACAQARHRYAFLLAYESGHQHLATGLRSWITGRHFAAALGLQKSHDICFRNASVFSGAGNHGRVEVMFLQQATHGGARLDRALRLFGRRCCLLCRLLLGDRCDRCNLVFLEDCQNITGDHGCPVFDDDLREGPGSRRRHLQNNLVRFQVDEVFVASDTLADVLVPRDKRCVTDRFG